MVKRPSGRAALIVVSCAVMLVVAGGTGAVAQRLITGKDIANGSVTGKDIKTGSLSGGDVRDGSITKADLATQPAGIPGPQGPQGPQGPSGPQGVQGPAGTDGTDGGPDEVRSWTVHYTGNGSNGETGGPESQDIALLTSTEAIPPRARVEVINVTVSGDFSNCQWSAVGLATVAPSGLDYVSLTQSMTAYTTPSRPGAPAWHTTGDQVEKLAVFADCDYGGGTGLDEHRPIPSFTATFTFGTTDVSSVPSSPFN